MHLPELISDLALMLGAAALVTLLFQKIRQPVVLGYILAGFLVGPFTPQLATVSDLPNIKTWAELGVIFLMFSLGLEFTFHKLARVGVAATGTAVLEVVLMVAVGFLAGQLLGWNPMDSLFLGGILSISSTTIIIKAFEEQGLKAHRFAEVVFGVLIIEDLVAILLLVALSTVAISQTFISMELVTAAVQLIFVVGSWFVVGFILIPRFLRFAGRYLNDESLTILSCGLCFTLVVIATRYHYSAALGAFIMGSILAETSEGHRIENLIRPLKDLFAAVFFVSVGMLVNPAVLSAHWKAVFLISLVTIVGKILSTSLGALLSGQPIKRSVQIGFSLAQIGEFSFIIASLGVSLKVTSDFLYPLAVAVSVVTTFTTPYLIRWSDPAGQWLERALPKKLVYRLNQFGRWMEGSAPDKSKKQLLESVMHGISILKGTKNQAQVDRGESLAPWDLHLSRLTVHQNARLAGMKLDESQVRSRFGLNVVAIQRGLQTLGAPNARDVLLPHDVLLILGTDEQIDVFRRDVELPAQLEIERLQLSDYSLKKLFIDDNSEFNGSIRESGIRHQLKGLVVGLERDGLRAINPEPGLVLKSGDVLWMVSGME